MSGGEACKCEEKRKPIGERDWVVMQRQCNHSAFNGRRWTPSEWSAIFCNACRCYWRTRAKYVYKLSDVRRGTDERV